MPAKKPYRSPKVVQLTDPEIQSLRLTSIARSLETIAKSLSVWVHLQEERFNREYPEKPEVEPASVGTAEYKTTRSPEADQEDEENPWTGEELLGGQEGQRPTGRSPKDRN